MPRCGHIGLFRCRGMGYTDGVRGLQGSRSDAGMVSAVLFSSFFFLGMTPGFWVPALTNILMARGLGAWVPAAFLIPPVCALVSPLIGGALADQRIAAERLFAWSSVLCALVLVAAFRSLEAGWHPLWFMGFLAIYSILSGPSWGLLATISLTSLPQAERRFPLVRVGGTFGWMIGGFMTSYLLHADSSPSAGYASAVARLACGIIGFMLPHTPPLGSGVSWKSRLGLDAFVLLKHRDQCVFFLVTALFSIPLAAFYMYAPEFLKALGDTRPTGTMAIAQMLEVAAMLLLGAVMMRYGVKTILLWALGLSVARYGLSAVAGTTGGIAWHIAGVALHGLCYTLYFITAQVFLDQRVAPGMKGQAQGLLAMVSGGIGPLIGTIFCGWLRGHCVSADGSGWEMFWGVLAAMIAVCFAMFAWFYQGRPRKTDGCGEIASG